MVGILRGVAAKSYRGLGHFPWVRMIELSFKVKELPEQGKNMNGGVKASNNLVPAETVKHQCHMGKGYLEKRRLEEQGGTGDRYTQSVIEAMSLDSESGYELQL